MASFPETVLWDRAFQRDEGLILYENNPYPHRPDSAQVPGITHVSFLNLLLNQFLGQKPRIGLQ